MSAVAKVTAGVAGTGTWITVTGWPAAAAAGTVLMVGGVLVCWVLASDERTARVLSLIAALRFPRR